MQVIELRKKIQGKEHSNTLSSMNNLASVYSQLGRYEEAERLHKDVLQARRSLLGLEHPNTLTSIRNLAFTYQYQGLFKEAEGMVA